MAKRLLDTEIFSDPWFRRLKPMHKLFWFYILFTCDIAGFWKVDIEKASWELGGELLLTELITDFDKRIDILNDGELWFIKRFVFFQQKVNSFKELNPKNGCHLGILRILQSRGYIKSIRGCIAPKEGLGRGKGIGIGIGIGNNNTTTTTTTATSNGQMLKHFDEIWAQYPRKLGKPDAIKRFKRDILEEKDVDDLKIALKNFLNSRQAKGDPKFIPYGSTWFNNWQDWIHYEEPVNEKEKEDEIRKSLGLRPKS
jgi:hypothetical protein